MQTSVINVKYSDSGLMFSLSVSGHSGSNRIGAGLEVCIALSTLTQSLVFALYELVGRDFCDYKALAGDFLLSCDLSKLDACRKKDYELVTKSYLVNIKKLSKEYQDYIRYTEE